MTTTILTAKVADLLDELGDLAGIAKENKFKVRAYKNAATTLREMGGVDFSETDPQDIDGIGEKIAIKIHQILATGTCDKLEELREQYGHLLPLLKIPGVGPANARAMYDEFGVTTPEGVAVLIKKGKKFSKRIREGVEHILGNDDRIPWEQADCIAELRVLEALRNEDVRGRIEVCGSYRRKSRTVGDIDVVVETNNHEGVSAVCVDIMDEVIVAGDTKVSGRIDGVQVDIRLVDADSFGACVLYFTGSKEFNIRMRGEVKKRGMKLNEYGLFKGDERIAGDTEEGIFDALGMEYVEPKDR